MSDPRELVDRLDALAVSIPPQWVVQNDTIWSSHSTMVGDRYVDDAVCQGGTNQRRYLNFIAALRNEYPALRVAALRAERLEGALRGTIGVVLELLRRTASMPEGIPTHDMVRAIEEAHAALTAPQGEESTDD